jgi:predicted transcriptional regulator
MTRDRKEATPAAPEDSEGRRAPGWLEHEVLATLWAATEPMTPAMVQAGLSRELAYTTVMTVLQRLHAKGLVRRWRSGRAYAYQPAVDAAEFAARQMRSALDRGHDRAAVLQRFVAGLSNEDEVLLHDLLGGTG